MALNVEQFLFTLPIMAKGMGGIFLVTAVIILTIVILNRVTSKSSKKED